MTRRLRSALAGYERPESLLGHQTFFLPHGTMTKSGLSSGDPGVDCELLRVLTMSPYEQINISMALLATCFVLQSVDYRGSFSTPPVKLGDSHLLPSVWLPEQCRNYANGWTWSMLLSASR